MCENVEVVTEACTVSSLFLSRARALCATRASCCCRASVPCAAPFSEALTPKLEVELYFPSRELGGSGNLPRAVGPSLFPALGGSRHVCAGQGSQKREEKMLRESLFGCCNAALTFLFVENDLGLLFCAAPLFSLVCVCVPAADSAGLSQGVSGLVRAHLSV